MWLIVAAFIAAAPLNGELALFNIAEVAPQYNGATVTLKGFFHETAEGELLLAPIPHLRSCCIATIPCVFLEQRPSASIGELVSVTGRFHIEGVPPHYRLTALEE